MAKTYLENQRLVQPSFQRYRNTYRGYRSSEKENLEMGQFLVDVNKLESNVLLIEETIFDNVRIFIGAADPENADIHINDDDGKTYSFSDLDVFYDGISSQPDPLEIDTISTIGSKLSKIAHKVKILERKKVAQ